MADTYRPAATMVQKVVVVNGSADRLGMLDSVLDAGHYDMVFVQSIARGYSQVKHVLPDLVVLCTTLEGLEGLQLLTMLKLDPETARIPVVTYTTELDGSDDDDPIAQFADDDDEMLAARPALSMN